MDRTESINRIYFRPARKICPVCTITNISGRIVCIYSALLFTELFTTFNSLFLLLPSRECCVLVKVRINCNHKMPVQMRLYMHLLLTIFSIDHLRLFSTFQALQTHKYPRNDVPLCTIGFLSPHR